MKNKDSMEVLRHSLKTFRSLTKAPEKFLSTDSKNESNENKQAKGLLKSLYDFLKQADNLDAPEVLPELIVEDLDEEQIWQQLELQNEAICKDNVKSISHLLSKSDNIYTISQKEDVFVDHNENEDVDTDNEEIDDGDDDEELSDSDESENGIDTVERKSKDNQSLQYKSVVDDKFFKLCEMEEFLLAEDRKEMDKMSTKPKKRKDDLDDEEEIDYFTDPYSDTEDEDTEANAMYTDFYGDDNGIPMAPQNGTKSHKVVNESMEEDPLDDDDDNDNDEEDEEELSGEEYDEEDEDDDGNGAMKQAFNGKHESSEEEDASDNEIDLNQKSTFDKQQDNLKAVINRAEDAAMRPKSWQLQGEITADSRPQDSLLTEALEFDATVRPAPIITEQTTLTLESIIRQRIKDKAWDDVVRKVKQTNHVHELRKELVLNQEKSKLSLAQVYEQDYLKTVNKELGIDTIDANEEPKEHKEIRTNMDNLFKQLDALSNFFFTPKPAAPEVKIITNTPAIDMEEVAPVAVTEAALLAPEEVNPKPRGGEVLGASEKTKSDKNRYRKIKKHMQREKFKKLAEKEAISQTKTGKSSDGMLLKKLTNDRNISKGKSTDDFKTLKSSTKFFNQLQDNTINKSDNKKRKNQNSSTLSAKKLKL